MKISGCITVAEFLVISLLMVEGAHSQGIRSSVVNLGIPGKWEKHAEWATKFEAEKAVFYEPTSGTVIHIKTVRAGHRSKQPSADLNKLNSSGGAFLGQILAEQQRENLNKLIRLVKGTESRLTEQEQRREVAQQLYYTFFDVPGDYLEEVYQATKRREKPPELLQSKTIPLTPQSFYVSQLLRGIDSEAEPAYASVKLLRGELRSLDVGEALILELVTENPADERVISRFKIPTSVKGQQIRYGLLMYSREGLISDTSTSLIAFGFATPLSSEINCELLLSGLPK